MSRLRPRRVALLLVLVALGACERAPGEHYETTDDAGIEATGGTVVNDTVPHRPGTTPLPQVVGDE